VGYFRNLSNNSGVIPGKLAIPPETDQPQGEASAIWNLGNKKLLDARFRGHDGAERPGS